MPTSKPSISENEAVPGSSVIPESANPDVAVLVTPVEVAEPQGKPQAFGLRSQNADEAPIPVALATSPEASPSNAPTNAPPPPQP